MEALHPQSSTTNTAAPPSPAPAAGGLDLRAILGRAIRQWYLFILFPALALFGGYLYLRYTVTEYEVRGVILIKESAEDQALADVVGEMGPQQRDAGIDLTNQIQILSSLSILLGVVDSLDLHVRYLSKGQIKDTDLYNPAMRPFLLVAYDDGGGDLYGQELVIQLHDDGLGYTLSQGDDFRVEGVLGVPLTLPFGSITLVENPAHRTSRKDATVIISNPILLARRYGNRLVIRTVRGSELLEISLVDRVPERAIDVINTIIAVYNQATIAEKNEVANKTLAFVNDRLSYLSQELDEVEAAAEDYVISNEIIGGAEREVEASFTEIAAQEQAIAQLEVQLDAIDRLETSLSRDPTDSLSYLPYSFTLENLNLSPLIAEYNQLRQERERLLTSARPDNPVLRPVAEQIAEAGRVITRTLNEARQRLRTQRDELRREQNAAWAELRRIPGKERGLLAIERQQNIREQLYLYLLQEREKTALSQATAVSNIRVLEEPMPRGSTGLGPLEVYGASLLLGLLFPIGIITLQELLDNTITSSEHIKANSPVPYLGAIALARGKENIVVTSTSRTAVAEMFRLLRTNLNFLATGRRQQTLLVTSTMSGEGKSFVSINLGMSLAISGKRVCLVGLDLRKPKMELYLADERRTVGVSSFLANTELNPADIINKSEAHTNLDYIGAGPIPPNPAELLMTDRLTELIDYLRAHYDYILLDSPPVVAVADGLLLRPHVDTTLYLTRFEKTKRGQLQLLNEMYAKGQLNNPAVILNGVKQGRGYGYGGYYGTGGYYGGGYGAGYYEEG